MIIFISKRNDHYLSDEIKRNQTDSFEPLIKFLQNQKEVGYDKEFSSLNVHKAVPLLTQIGNEEIQFVVDDTSMDLTQVASFLQGPLLIGHNIKIDYKVSKLQGILLTKLYDTMVAEQVITKGMKYRYSLDAVCQRRLGILPLDKETRNEFSGADKSFRFTTRHIEYAADDVKWMIPLRNLQHIQIDKYGYYKDLYELEFPLIRILADAELEGCYLNEKAWRENIRKNELKLLDISNKLDSILLSLSKDYPILKTNYTLHKHRKKEKIEILDLFGDSTIVENNNSRNINYGSSTQVLKIFSDMILPFPKIKEEDPITKEKIWKNSTREEAIEQYKIDHPDNILVTSGFIDLYLKYGGTQKAITSYGDRFLVSIYKRKGKKSVPGYKNEITGKVHTIYRQQGTDTTRMASGDTGRKQSKTDFVKDIAFFNSQNIPADNIIRNCFMAPEGYLFCPEDLSGAELVIGASLSNDKNLIKYIKQGDPHSPLATASYSSIISYIVENMPEKRARMELRDLLKANPKKLGEEIDGKFVPFSKEKIEEITNNRVELAYSNRKFIINKKDSPDLRDPFKNIVYGSLYGAGKEKIGETLAVSKVYAELIEKSMRSELPELFKFLDEASKFGVDNGYIRFNNRYGGRHWFLKILEARERGYFPNNKIKGDVERACKNYPIQATQGHMIKEATVRYFDDYVYPNNYDVTLIFQVHDELVIQFRKEEPEHAYKLKDYLEKTCTEYLVPGLEMKVGLNKDGKLDMAPFWFK